MCVRGKSLRRSRRGGEGREEEETKAGMMIGGVGRGLQRKEEGAVHVKTTESRLSCPWEVDGIPTAQYILSAAVDIGGRRG